jgi:undecaprenyl-phosphate 4-deoxy-4-formamido-L-arabinose transferase
MNSDATIARSEHTVAIVVPVYQGEHVLPALVEELDGYTTSRVSAGGARFRVSEVILVHDAGPDLSDVAIRELADRYDYVRPVWLSRNFGQHAATLAGMSSTTADWIATMDEDGQHDPEAIGSMLDTALATRSPVVYAEPSNRPPHGFFRNVTSRIAHWTASLMGVGPQHSFHSYRLVLGEIGRGLAAYCGESVYLDVALTWVVDRTATCEVAMREERGGSSGYSPRRLASHFWRMVLTSGTRPLRLVALFGALLGIGALVLTGWVLWARLNHQVPVQGWTSVMVILLVTSGAVLFSLGILAEYLAIASKSAMGKPLYLVVNDPAEGPLGRALEDSSSTHPADSETSTRAEPAMPAQG